ncbi:hypothetical protein [Bradyrhizobium mercantei]|uniref:hypothetical protein n=1 Tax=Bradyrhizobium mercantei TaxID=1904807 RepID=UPI001FD8D5D0|nr:hypothetical protein [Bradyrhizobium mercantei]
MERRARPVSLAWSNPVVRWWGLLSLVSAANIAVWFALYRQFHEQASSSFSNTSGIGLMLLLCAAYVFGCAFRSVLPRADVQRICLVDTWLSSVMVGRTVATVAEVCFAAQWAIILHQLGTMTGAETTVTIAWIVVPLIVIAECFSWYAVLTTHYLCNAIENSIWAVVFFLIGIALCRLLPEFHGPVRWAFIVAIVGIAAFLAFLMTIDVPMYLNRWRANLAAGGTLLHPLDGLRDVSRRWVVTHDIAEWREEIAWMSLYFSMAVWSSLALCVGYSLEDQLPRYRTEPAIVATTPATVTPAIAGTAPAAQHTATIDAAAPSQN